MRLKTIIISGLTALLLLPAAIKAQTISIVQQGRPTSIRGLSVVDDKTAWVSGSKGNVALSTDGGKTWAWQQVKGYEKSDFRDIEAFSDKEAVIMSSGTPAVILKTTDGGVSWQEKYRKTDSVYFLDAMDFANKQHGFIMGDPIKDKFLLLETVDGGETWAEYKNAPTAFKNEAAFAASGTCLRVSDLIMIVTGGSKSRLLTTSALSPQAWAEKPLPLTNGVASRGAFSVAVGKDQFVIVGGNYAKDTLRDSVAYILQGKKGAVKEAVPVVAPAGYQSCVEYLDGNIFIATGTPGSNITTDGGKTWRKVDAKSYNVCRKAKKGKLVLLAGDGGKIGIYNL